MGFKIIIKPIVFFDVEEAVDYYNGKNEGLGKRFYNHFLSALSKIHDRPFTFTFVTSEVRRCKVEKFPYKVFYTVSEATIFVLGVAHAKRSNAFVRRRLKGE